MTHKLATAALMAALAATVIAFVGCSDGDSPLVPLVPSSSPAALFTQDANGNAVTVLVDPNQPKTYTTRKGVVLSLVCPPDPANCGDRNSSPFACQDDAQEYYRQLAAATGKTDCAGLDGDGDGRACNGIGLPQSCP